MVTRQLQRRPPVYQALERDVRQWKRFLVLHAMIAEIRYADMTDTDDPKSLAWEHEPMQPASDKGPWPKWLNELVLFAVQHVPDFQTNMHADNHAQQRPRPSAHPQHMPIRKFPYPPVAHASHRMKVAIIEASHPIDSVIYCSSCGTYATRKWSRRFARPCPKFEQTPTAFQGGQSPYPTQRHHACCSDGCMEPVGAMS
eukprot:6475293-Amphidinium_carterae.1